MRRLSILLAFVLLACTVTQGFAQLVTPLNDRIVSVRTTAREDTRDKAVELAKRQAIQAVAGRVLLDGNLLRADNLLAKYIDNYAAEFVLGTEILSDSFTGGQTVIDALIFVDNDKLTKDLTEKRFIYVPAHRPQFTVFLSELLDGKPIGEQPAREILRDTLGSLGLKSYAGEIDEPSPNSDVAASADTMAAAIVAAERRNIEIVFSGSSDTKLQERKKLYYDQFYFYECNMTLQMIRADTGEVLRSVDATGNGSARDQGQAISLAIARASSKAANELIADYRADWPVVVQNKADFQLLLTGADDELLSVIRQHLEGLSRDTRVELRKKYDSSAVIAIATSVTRERLIEYILSTPFPTLTIVREDGETKLEIQVSG